MKFAVTLMVITTFLTSAAQILYKFGVIQGGIFGIINYYVIGGLILYAIGAVIFIIALKYGQVTVLFPIITLGYIWVNLGSAYFFNEILNIYKWIGVCLIMIGVVMINLQSDTK